MVSTKKISEILLDRDSFCFFTIYDEFWNAHKNSIKDANSQVFIWFPESKLLKIKLEKNTFSKHFAVWILSYLSNFCRKYFTITIGSDIC